LTPTQARTARRCYSPRGCSDLSQLLAASGDNAVTGLAEDPSGRLLVAAADQAAGRISVYELLIGSNARCEQ
jgi:hypothetical protein